MSETISNQVAALAAVMIRVEQRLDDDRKDRKSESEIINKALAHDRANAEMTRSAVSAALADISHGQADVVRRLDKIEPITDLVTSIRSKIIGGVMVLGVIGGVVWGGIIFFKEIIMGWFQ